MTIEERFAPIIELLKTLPQYRGQTDEHRAKHLTKGIADLVRLGGLKDDFDGCGSRAPTPEVLAEIFALLHCIRGHDELAIEAPFIAATHDGGIQIEWDSSADHRTSKTLSLEIEVERPGHISWLKEERVTTTGEFDYGEEK